MASSPTRLDLRKAKALVVDDNPQSLDLLAQVLMGFRLEQIQTSRSAEEARELIRTATFDLVIVDSEMPGEDGISLTRHVRDHPDLPNFTAPIILVSCHTPLEMVLRARDAGANMVVKKPISPAVLLSRIEWLARDTRPFVTTATYCGPDRRFKSQPLPEGIEERRTDALALAATPERAMSQDDVDALFG